MGELKINVDDEWVPVTGSNNVGTIPPAGKTGQILTKRTTADFDTVWSGVATTQYTADVGWHEVGAAGEPAFMNAWRNLDTVSWNSAAFRVDADGWVYLKGLVCAGTSTIFTLPAAYRPWKTMFFPAIAQEGMNCYVQINPNGTVDPYLMGGTNGWVTLETVRFPVWNTWSQYAGRYFPLEGQELRGSFGELLTGLWPQTNGMTRIMGISGSLPAAGVMTRMNDLSPSVYSYMFGVATADNGGGRGAQVSKRLGFYSAGAGSSWTMYSTEFGTFACEDRWIAPDLLNGWRNYGSDTSNWHTPAGYWKDDSGVVHIRGTVVAGSSATAGVFVLPVGYRPEKGVLWYGYSASGATCRVEVMGDGRVQGWSGASTGWTSYNGINFYAAGV
jgi:hypothetical protein